MPRDAKEAAKKEPRSASSPRVRAAECASTQKNIDSRELVFFIRPQALEASSKNALPYDDGSSGAIIYAYVGGNPLSYTDPYGLWRLPDFVSFQINYYVGNISGTFSRSGNSFFGMGSNKGIPNPVGAGASVNVGWLNTCDAKATGSKVDSFLDVFAGGGVAAYAGVGGGALWSPGNGTATVVGVGAGVNVGGAPKFGGSPGYDVSRNLGPTGLGGW